MTLEEQIAMALALQGREGMQQMSHTRGRTEMDPIVEGRLRRGWSLEDAMSVPVETPVARLGQAIGGFFEGLTPTEGLSMAPIPVLSDVAGLKADAEHYAANPESLTLENALWSALGLLPFVPAHTVWHGSPHKWDQADISKVGTGEGAQAYGHGFYSADSESVAKSYQDALAVPYDPSEQVAAANRLVRRLPDDWVGPYGETSDLLTFDLDSVDDINLLANYIDELSVTMPEDLAQQMRDVSSSLKGADDSGYLYKLDIPDEDIPKYLDWDKPLSEQSDDIQSALKDMLPKHRKLPGGIIEFNGKLIDGPKGEITGREAYLMLSEGGDMRKAHKSISERLNAKGIPGIRYLDGTSRSAGEGTYNYVTFDPSRIKTLERNGQPIATKNMSDTKKVYHVARHGWNGEDIESLYMQMGEDAYDEYAKIWPESGNLSQYHANQVHLHDSLDDAIEFQKMYGGDLLEIDQAELIDNVDDFFIDDLEYAHPVVTGSIPAELIKKIR